MNSKLKSNPSQEQSNELHLIDKPNEKTAGAEKIKALVVDDNYDFYVILQLTLKDEMTLDYAPDGFTALQMVKKDNYEIILCDVFMPLISGLVLLSEFKKKNINIPFLFITGNVNDKIIKEALHLGAYNLLEKPFKKEDLLAKAYRAIKLHDEDAPNELDDQEKAYIYNTLKMFYYDVEKIMRSIHQINMPVSTIQLELEKKINTGKCVFDDLSNLKFYRSPS